MAINNHPLKKLKHHYRGSLLQTIQYKAVTGSTNDDAKEITPLPGVVVAGRQISGRGRYQRIWLSTGDNLYFSLIFPVIHWEELSQVMITVAVTLKDFLEDQINYPVTLKWPNDLLIDQKKCCGILTEVIPSNGNFKEIIGIGINCNSAPPQLQEAISLAHYCGPIDVMKFLGDFLNNLEHRMCHEGGYTEAVQKWYEYCNLTGRQITTTTGGERITGVVTGMDHHGGLHLQKESGEIMTVIAGDIAFNTPPEDRC